MSLLHNIPTDKATITKNNGEILGPYDATFTKDKVILWDYSAVIDKGDRIERKLPNGNIEKVYVTEWQFNQQINNTPTHFIIETKRELQTEKNNPQQNININSANATVQIGDHNTQHITSAIQELAQKIDSSSASGVEKEEAKSLLQKFISHPLVTSIVGSAISLSG